MLGESALFRTISCLSVLLVTQSQKLSSGPRCFIRKKNTLFDTKYVQDGDVIIGGIFTVTSFYSTMFEDSEPFCDIPIPRYYRYILAFIYAIDEINKNPELLPNVTLGYHVTDSCNNVNKAVESVLQILSGDGDMIPNYSCQDHDKLAGLIGDQSSERSLHIAQMLKIYGYPQISYGATDPILSNKHSYPSFFQTLPSDQTQYLAIVKLLIHFGWTWIGVIASDDDGGEKQCQELKKVTANHGLCIEFIIKIASEDTSEIERISEKSMTIFNNSTSQIVVLCGIVSLPTVYFIEQARRGGHEKTLIIPASSNVHIFLPTTCKASLHGSLVFSTDRKKIPHMKTFLEEASHANRPNDFLLEYILATTLNCSTSNSLFNMEIESRYDITLYKCKKSVQLGNLSNIKYYTQRFGTTYQVYKAVYAMAHSLHEMQFYMSRKSNNTGIKNLQHMHKYFLRRVRFQDPTGEEVYFNERGEMSTFYYIQNYAVLTDTRYRIRVIGSFNASREENQLIIYQGPKIWKHVEIPVSICSTDCPPGYRRVLRRGIHRCCFDCVQCSDGEISNDRDKVSCQKCPEDQWPSEKNQCVQKPIEFLSYKKDPIAVAISIISVLCSVKTSIILSIFILFRDTPLVKANNQNLSFILLVSIMLSFLCVLLFLGQPVSVTCMFRQTSFGIIFSVAVSSILAKTIMVYMAFKATKPGSSWRKFIGLKLTNCVVFLCSFLQVLISIIWLCISPPFPERNSHTYLDKIIIQCNEGSVLAFSIILGYMGILAAVSFIAAFLARNLPDNFNEAKYITFSMLLFCSVWIAFIPAYLSTTGKNAVLVEIFAIISSSIGILGCLFFPKCYIILVRPDLNSKSNLQIRKVQCRH